MGKKSKIVFSTNPDFQDGSETKEVKTLNSYEQDLRIWRQKLGGGRVMTVIKGFVGNETDLKKLGKRLKSLCSAGGSVKNGEILIQGDHRKQILNILKSIEYNAKISGG